MLTTRSKNPWYSSETEPLSAQARAFLAALCRRPAGHARFLNTLSLMEHIGSRKIMLCRQGRGLAQDTLKHLAEEARHAHFFRRAAERVAGRSLDGGSEDSLAPWAARMYFERLDAAVTRRLGGDGALAYRYVTLAVELRARWFYGLYQQVLTREGLPLSLKSVLAEEDEHLRHVGEQLGKADPLFEPRRAEFARLEAVRFERWFAAMRRAVPYRRRSRSLGESSARMASGRRKSGRLALPASEKACPPLSVTTQREPPGPPLSA